MASDPPISVIVHTRNSAATLSRLLRSVDWADEILIIDMESRDDTKPIAAAAGARIIEIPAHPRVDAVRTDNISEAVHEWVLVLDSDEYLAADSRAAVAALIAEHGQAYDAFAIPRFNWFGDRRLEGSRRYPDRQIRLFRRGTVAWTDATHRHPRVTTGRRRLLRLKPPGCLHIHHANYTDIGHLAAKQVEYARNDLYPDDPAEFSFEDYVSDAFAEYRRRLDRDQDGDYSVALATLMAWDKIIRGLIHWDRLGRKTKLPDIFSLPVLLKPRGSIAGRAWRVLARIGARFRK